MSKVDVGQLTQGETLDLLRECIGNLSLENVITALLVEYGHDDREEIIASLEAHRNEAQ